MVFQSKKKIVSKFEFQISCLMDAILYLNNSWPYVGNLKDFEAKHICENPNLICQNIQKMLLKIHTKDIEMLF